MYLAVDIGGSKTLLAAFDESGTIKNQIKFPTPQNYREFLEALKIHLASLGDYDFVATGVGVPGILNRQDGVVLKLGNLAWENETIKSDIEKITNCTVFIENDAKLAGLYEASKDPDFKKVLYVTFGTGIGVALVINGENDLSVDDAGGKYMMFEYEGKKQPWEEFASGHAIVKKYGKKARDIEDASTWKEIAERFAVGIRELINIYKPDALVIGGGVGQYFDRYSQYLTKALEASKIPNSQAPKLLPANHPEEAVLYGCLEFIKSRVGANA